MKLYLVRHGEPKSEREDPSRPLSDKGIADVTKVADSIAGSWAVSITNVYHSGKARAKQTAEIFAAKLNLTDALSESDGLKPMDDPEVWINRIRDRTGDMMLVGHLPFMGRLSTILLFKQKRNDIINFTAGTIVCLERVVEDSWVVRWVVSPELFSQTT